MSIENLPTYETIIVPLDGSRLAEKAVPFAVAIAEKTGARINLVTVVLSHSVPLRDQMDELTLRTLQHTNAELQVRFPTVTQTVLAGDPADELARHAESIGADLIVMATHGRSGFRRLLLGSVADRLVSTSPVPVLLVKQDEKEAGPLSQPAAIDRIVVPLDGSEASHSVLPYAAELARITGSKSVIIHVAEGYSAEESARMLESVSGELSETSVEVETRVLEGEPGPSISEFASIEPGTLVVMASLGATGLGGSRRHSVADYIIKHSASAVMVVPPVGYVNGADN